MYKIYFYRDKDGNEPVADYIAKLASKNDKDSRIKANKIRDYVKALSMYGTSVGEPYVKHLEGEIWEIRPIRDRILFAAWVNGSFVLLHCFMKKTQKTPPGKLKRPNGSLRI